MSDQAAVITDEIVNKAEGEMGAGLWGIPPEKKPDVKAEGSSEVKPDIKPEEGKAPDTDIFDEPTYLKTNYGYETPDALKKELQELADLREKAKTPAEIKFANEETKKFYSYLTEPGKEDELLAHLQTKKLIEKAEKVNIENPKEATELL